MYQSKLASLSKKVKNTLFITTLITGLLSPIFAIASETANPPQEITFLTWANYINEDVVTQFEKKYHAKVNFVIFESDDARNDILTTSDVARYDLILLDSVNIPLYKKLNWITHFNPEQAPNISNAKLPSLADSKNKTDICTPYFWGSTGIAYRSDLVPEPITSWQQIFKPAPELKGKILMSTMSQEVVGMALKSLGYSMRSSNKKELEEARQLLIDQSPSVAGYSAVVIDAQKSKLITGAVSVALTYNTDALMLKEFNQDIEYVVPKEGGAIWADFICLSVQAKNSELAHHFIDFINQPQQAADNALYINAATTNSAAQKLLPAEFLSNPFIYPTKEVLARSETEKLLSPRTKKKQNLIMTELSQILDKQKFSRDN